MIVLHKLLQRLIVRRRMLLEGGCQLQTVKVKSVPKFKPDIQGFAAHS